MHDVACRSRGVRLAGYEAVRIVLGMILLSAAAFKGRQMATGLVAQTDLSTSRWFLIGVVAFELFLGLGLVWGQPRRSEFAARRVPNGFPSLSG